MTRILFTCSAREGRGSWEIRGRQMARELSAEAVLNAPKTALAKADLVVVVKVVSPDLLKRIRQWGGPWVLDILDAWPQPAGNRWNATEAREWLKNHVRQLAPNAIVCANQAMAMDLESIWKWATVYHHARPSATRNPIRDEVRRIGYEGSARYLEGWSATIEAECKRRGWGFVVNPPSIDWLDIVVAVRGGAWAGYAPSQWKSNVKLANAQATGTPIVCQTEASYVETATGGELFVETPRDIAGAFHRLASHEERERRSRLLRKRDMTLPTIAGEYRRWLDSLATSRSSILQPSTAEP